MTRTAPASFGDHFSQARLFYLSLTEVEREHLTQAFSFELGKCYEEAIKVRYLDVLAHVDQELAEKVADNLGLPHPEANKVADVEPSPALSQVGKTWPIDGRQVAVLISGDTPADGLCHLLNELFDASVTPLLVSDKGGTLDVDGMQVSISRTYATARSIEFDAAVVINPPATAEVATMLGEFDRHKKALVLAGADAAAALKAAYVPTDQPGIIAVDSFADAPAKLADLLASHRVWER